MAKKYNVDLTPDERQYLEHYTTTGKHAAYQINHARILLKAVNPTEVSETLLP